MFNIEDFKNSKNKIAYIESVKDSITKFKWNNIISNENLSQDFIKVFYKSLNLFSMNERDVLLPSNVIEYYLKKTKYVLDTFIKHQILSNFIIVKYFFNKSPNIENWDWILRYQQLEEDFIFEMKLKGYFSDHINPKYYFNIRTFKETKNKFKYIKQLYNEKVLTLYDWNYINGWLELDKPIRKLFFKIFKNKLDWYIICKHRKLTDKFMVEFKDVLIWEVVFRYQKPSDKFIKKFAKYNKEWIVTPINSYNQKIARWLYKNKHISRIHYMEYKKENRL